MADFTDEEILQFTRLRRDVGASEDLLTNDIAQSYFDESAERYPADTTKMRAYSRVLVLQGIRANAAMLGKYAQNQSMEDHTKVFDNLTKQIEDWRKQVDIVSDPIEENANPFFFGVIHGQRGR